MVQPYGLANVCVCDTYISHTKCLTSTCSCSKTSPFKFMCVNSTCKLASFPGLCPDFISQLHGYEIKSGQRTGNEASCKLQKGGVAKHVQCTCR